MRKNMKNSPKRGKRVYRFSLWQDGLRVASVEGCNKKSAEQEIMKYALTYSQDGKVVVMCDTAPLGKKFKKCECKALIKIWKIKTRVRGFCRYCYGKEAA